ncbi:MAG: S8 family peptidase [Alphaproteobacteria bacterium]
MANNPVQIVLNDSDFIKPPEPGKMGANKEFFAHRDDEFIAHKKKVISQTEKIQEFIQTSSYGPATYASVKLRDEALPKSYRPTQALFQPDKFPCAGVGKLGEMYYLVSSQNVSTLISRMKEADEFTNKKISKKGKPYFSPNAERSEIGAIESVDLLHAEEKINFSLEEAINWFRDPGISGGYLIELFEMPEGFKKTLGRGELLESLEKLLISCGNGMEADFLRPFGQSNVIDFRLTSSGAAPRIRDLRSQPYIREKEKHLLNDNYDLHSGILLQLAQHPLVRRISLPPKIMLSTTEAIISAQIGAAKCTPKIEGQKYPKVGVIDTGVASCLKDWIVDRHDFLQEDEVEKSHGTFISGLLVDAQNFNGNEVGREENGCLIYDIPLFPKGNFSDTYKSGFQDFLEEIEQAVLEAKEKHGIKIFNLSINATVPVEADEYSYYASRLDEISEKYGVIFINSVGNLPINSPRSPWPKQPTKAIEYFAARTEPDTIYKPSESVYSLAVGAVNPPNIKDHIQGTPTTYTRRGPGLRVGNKPDLAHYGGSQPCGTPQTCGLTSISQEGNLVTGCGTSYAAPMVAKTLASLDERIENEDIDLHVLRALLIHHTEIPKSISSARLKELARQFVGFGLPLGSNEMLITDDHAITMVFNSRLMMGTLKSGTPKPKILRFPFTWPQSLVDPLTNACHGAAKMTMVYLPPLDRRFGSEFVRINLDAKLQQRQPQDTQEGNPSFNSVINQCYLPKTAEQPAYEKELIKQGLKWWPTKKYEKIIPDTGCGNSSEWRLQVESTMRAEADFPTEGVPFALVVTIYDPKKSKPVFQELRRDLQAKSVQLSDIRSTVRIKPKM